MSQITTSDNLPKTALGKTANYVDERVGGSKILREFGRKIFPDHWSFMLGEVALYSFLVLILSGTFLTFFFVPAMGEVHYEGSYVPLQGLEVSQAYASTLDISFDVRGGLLMRQIHHWSALLFVAAIVVHMMRVFFTGAFRKPRELNWVVGCVLLILAMAAGFTGYSLPDDLLSGNGLRIIDGVIKSVPVVGTYISFFLFGGEFPGTVIISRLYSLHIMIIPAMILLLIAVHLFMVVTHKHTQYPGSGRKNNNVVGYPLAPVYAAKAGGFFFIVFGFIAFISALFTVNPIWNYGPYDPSPVSAGTQPDWYIGWVDGALRLMPGFAEYVIWGRTLSLNILLPALVVPLIFLTLVTIYPFIEAWITKDKKEHHVLDRPRNVPTRTGLGVAGIIFYCVLWAAAAGDLIATHFHLSLNDVIYWFQALVFVGPVLGFIVTRRICLGLQRKDRSIVLHGRETGRIVKLPHGEFTEVHKPLDTYKQYSLLNFESNEVVVAAPDVSGKITRKEKLRGFLSKFYFGTRIPPVTVSELEQAHKHGDSFVESVESVSVPTSSELTSPTVGNGEVFDIESYEEKEQ